LLQLAATNRTNSDFYTHIIPQLAATYFAVNWHGSGGLRVGKKVVLLSAQDFLYGLQGHEASGIADFYGLGFREPFGILVASSDLVGFPDQVEHLNDRQVGLAGDGDFHGFRLFRRLLRACLRLRFFFALGAL
jgi:hypothetical protein